MITSANREMKLIPHSTRERKLSTNFLGWYMYESPLESEHYRLPWFQSSSEESSSPLDAPGVHIIITLRSSTAKEMTALEAVEVADMELPEAVELF